MGLDMYLTAVLDVSPSKQYELKTLFPEVESIEKVSTTIGYWCKAQAIHSWFVENVQYGNDDCRAYNVYEDEIKALLNIVDNVIDKRQKPEEVLPSSYDSDYSEFYFENLALTKKILERALKLSDSGWTFKYQSSW
jgi:hypothetical protein